MRLLSLTVLSVFFMMTSIRAQVGIGTTTPDASSILEIESTTQGLLIPRLTQVQRLTISNPATGLLVYQSDATVGFYYNGGSPTTPAWTLLGSGSTSWGITGTSGTNPSTNFIGTTDDEPFVFRTDNVQAIKVDTDGNVGIGNVSSPEAPIHIAKLDDPTAVQNEILLRLEDGNQANGYVLISDANGNATWTDVSTAIVTDDDWRFSSGNTIADPIHRTGTVRIGSIPGGSDTGEARTGRIVNIGTPNQYESDILLDVFNGLTEGTSIGIGDSFMIDGASEFRFAQDIVPNINNSYSLGASGFLWSEVHTINGIDATSDRREKEDIQSLAYGSKEVLNIQTVSYQWKNEQYGTTVLKDVDKKVKIGFIAQNLQEILPETVVNKVWVEDTNKDGLKTQQPTKKLGVRYTEVIPVIVAAIQEDQGLIKKIEAQQLEIERLLKVLKN